jgi:hypothetical protein
VRSANKSGPVPASATAAIASHGDTGRESDPASLLQAERRDASRAQRVEQ